MSRIDHNAVPGAKFGNACAGGQVFDKRLLNSTFRSLSTVPESGDELWGCIFTESFPLPYGHDSSRNNGTETRTSPMWIEMVQGCVSR